MDRVAARQVVPHHAPRRLITGEERDPAARRRLATIGGASMMDPAGTALDTLALLITFLGAGWLAGVAVIPERLGPITRLLLSLALSVSATVVLAFPGLVSHRLGAGTFLPALGALAVIAAVRSRGSLRSMASPDARARWSAAARSRPSLRGTAPLRVFVALAALGIGVVAVLLPQLEAADPNGLLNGTTPWYYYRLVLEMVGASGVPAALGEWGSLRPYPVEYLGTTLHTSITGMLGGAPDLPFMEGYRIALVVAGIAAAYALWRRWLPAWWAWIAAVLTLLLLRTSTRFISYRPETFGLVLVLWSAWLLDQALARRSLRWAVLAGIVSGVAFHAHAEVWLVTGPLWGGILVGRLLVPWLGRVRRSGPMRDAPLLRLLAIVMVAVLGFAGVAAVAAATGTSARIAAITDKPGTAALRAKYGDPTWAFYQAITGIPRDQPPPTGFWDPLMQDETTVTPWWALSLDHPLGLTVVIAAILLLVWAAARGDARLRRLAVTLPLYAVGIFVGAFVLWYLYDTYVPARAGPRRLLAFHALALAALLPAAASVAIQGATRFARRRSARGAGRDRALTATARAASLLVGAGLVAWLSIPGGTLSRTGGQLSQEGYAAMTWMRDNLPHDGVVMANTYTDGSIGTITGMIGWLDGRAPYLEDPGWLDQSIERLRRAHDFFYDPKFIEVPDGVDYVLAGQKEDLAGYWTWADPVSEIDWGALRSYERLRLVRSFGDDRLMLFRVVPPGAQGEG